MPYTVEFIETPLFTRLIQDYLDDAEYSALQWSLAVHPETGDVVPGSGGVRKLRWQAKGLGKRGGLRVIYYWRNQAGEIWLLTVYSKNKQENIQPAMLKKWKQEIEKS